MNLTRFRFSSDWAGGVFSGTSLDSTVNVSQYGHPAIQAGTPIASTLGYSGARLGLAANGTVTLSETNHPTSVSTPLNVFSGSASAWTLTDEYMLTPTAGDAFQFTTTAQSVTFTLPGIAVSGAGTVAGQASTPALAMDSSNATHGALSGVQSGDYTSASVRNGAIATIAVNGQVVGTVDTYNQVAVVTVSGLAGTSNVIEVYHSGTYSPLFQPWTPASNVTGTSVAGNLQISAQTPHPTFSTAQWRVVVTTGPQWKIQKNTGTIASPTWTDQVTGLALGAADTTHVPGLWVSLPSGPTYSVGDTAQFTTDVAQLAIGTVLFNFGSAANGTCSYTSPVIDSGNAQAQWFLAQWTEAAALGAGNFTLKVGNTPSPDGSWTTQAFTPTDTILPISRARYGLTSLCAPSSSSSLPRGRYAQFVIAFPPALQTGYVRDLALYYWVPEQDTVVLSKLGFPPNWVPDPLTMAPIVGTIECALADTRQLALDFQASGSIGKAVDQWLQGYGADFGLVEWSGIPPQGFQAIVQSALQSHPQGSSIPGLQKQIALLVLGPSGSPSSITITAGANNTYTVTIPAPAHASGYGTTEYAGLPGVPTGAGSLARTIISNFVTQVLNPICAIPQIIFS
jgi:hypothetical protein